MAGISKVTYDNEVLLDLTQDTVNPDVLLSGFTAHAANGDAIGGALTLGALAYLNSIDYNSEYLTNKPGFGALAFQNFIDYESDQIINKPKTATASDTLELILETYPNIPEGIPFAIFAAEDRCIYLNNETMIYDGHGMVLLLPNPGNVTANYIDGDHDGIRIIFPPIQYIPDVPDNNKLYARRHGEWVEINV